jgi:pre-60S factor REI1
LACGLAFSNMIELKDHYRTDLHRCNLTRKVQGMLPLGAEDFNRRAAELLGPTVQAPVGKDKHSRKKAKDDRQRAREEERARRRENKMLKHQAKMEAAMRPDAVTIDSEEEQELMLEERIAAAPKLELTQCIFSGTKFDTFEAALSHMARNVRATPYGAMYVEHSALTHAVGRSTAFSFPTWST